ncbi:MAG: TIGR03667 family PPOX class F420-dependent oxidoreductase [Anaerolineae bacterium]
MTVTIESKYMERIQKGIYAWLTTVRADGTPQPTPVWYIWDNGTFLMYSIPNQQKIRNILINPTVTLAITDDPSGEEYVVITGEAAIDESAPRVIDNAPYVEKYRKGMEAINFSPESMTRDFTTAIRITPTGVRGQ